MFSIAKKIGWEIFRDSVKFTWDSTFVDALGPRDAIEIKPKSNTDAVSNWDPPTNSNINKLEAVQHADPSHPGTV